MSHLELRSYTRTCKLKCCLSFKGFRESKNVSSCQILGRPRRCGWLDIPLLKFTSQINGYTALALTKIDILDKLDEIKIGVNYVKNGKVMEHYPSNVYQCEGRVDHEIYQIFSEWKG